MAPSYCTSLRHFSFVHSFTLIPCDVINLDIRLINDLCKSVPDQRLLEPVLERLLERKNAITDQALLAFLVPSRTQLLVQGLQTIRNSTLKMIGYNCPNLRVLNLSDCDKVSNSVVRGILQGCHSLEHLRLDRCPRVTDASFDVHQSPFHTLGKQHKDTTLLPPILAA